MTSRGVRLSFYLALLMIGVLVFSATPTRAAGFVVNDGGDLPDAVLDGACDTISDTCTLRAAIQEANFVAGIDTILFDTGIFIAPSTITPLTLLPTITGGLSIEAPLSARVTIDASAIGSGNGFRVNVPGGLVSFTNLNVTGSTTSAIEVGAGAISVTNSDITGNSGSIGAAIYNVNGSVTLNNVLIQNNTGTINTTSLTTGTIVRVNNGSLSMTDVTINANLPSATRYGSTVFVSGGGPSSLVSISATRVNITGNFGHGLVGQYTTFNADDLTASENRGFGVHITGGSGAMIVQNSAVNGNESGGLSLTNSYNSPSIALTNVTIDGNTNDIGAYLVTSSRNDPVTVSNSTFNNNGGNLYLVQGDLEITNSNFTNGSSSTRAAVANGNGDVVMDTVLVQGNNATSSNFSVTSGAIIGVGTGSLTMTDVTVSGNTFNGGMASAYGNTISVYGSGPATPANVSLTRVTISSNAGRALAGQHITFNATDLTVTNNNSDGIYIPGSVGAITIHNSAFEGNGGYGVYLNPTSGMDTITVTDSNFDNNFNTHLYTSQGSITSTNTDYTDGLASTAAAIYTGSGGLSLSQALIQGNSVSSGNFSVTSGAVITVANGSLEMTDVIVNGNTRSGGGSFGNTISVYGSGPATPADVSLLRVNITGNSGRGLAGQHIDFTADTVTISGNLNDGVYIPGSMGAINLQNATIASNVGYGVYLNPTSGLDTITINASSFDGNANTHLYTSQGSITSTNTNYINGNASTAAAIYSGNGSLTISNALIQNNVVTSTNFSVTSGAVITVGTGSLTMTDVTVSDNIRSGGGSFGNTISVYGSSAPNSRTATLTRVNITGNSGRGLAGQYINLNTDTVLIANNSADGVYIPSSVGAFTIHETDFVNNVGHGLYLAPNSALDTITLTDSDFSGSANTHLYTSQGVVSTTNTDFLNGTASSAVAVYNGNGSVSLTNALIQGNVATSTNFSVTSGAIIGVGGSLTMTDVTVNSNTRSGGGSLFGNTISAYGSSAANPATVSLTRVNITNNTGRGLAGQYLTVNGTDVNITGNGADGMYITPSVGAVSLENGTIENNVGYGVYLAPNSALDVITFENVDFIANLGHVYANQGQVSISNGDLINTPNLNTPIYVGNGSLSISTATISGNITSTRVIQQDSGSFTLTDVTVGPNYSPTASPFTNTVSLGVSVNATLTRTKINGNAGPALNTSSGSLTVNDSEFIGNNGTGLYLTSTNTTVSNSTIAGNSGYGIFINGSTVNVINSTVANNSQSAIFNTGTLQLSNSTVSGNGVEGIANFGAATVRNSIVAGNSGTDCSGSALTRNANNLLDSTCLPTGTDISTTDPMLNALGNYGGLTQTMPPMTGSPAIEAGDNSLVPIDTPDRDNDGNISEPIPFDQRGTGFARVVNGTVDIGAVEVQSALPPAPGFIIEPSTGLVTTEAGGTAQFTVRLTTQPTATVRVALSTSDTTEGIVAPSFALNAFNWNTGVTVTITGVNDNLADGNIAYTIITGAVTSTDPNYSAILAGDIPDVSVTNNDDEPAVGVIVTPSSGLTTTEAGGTAVFNVRLATQPTANVTIALSSSDTTEGTVPTGVTITTVNWNTGVNITITGKDDVLDDGDIAYTIITGAVTSADPNYSAISAANIADVSVTNTDNDGAGFVIDLTSGLVTTEAGGTATFTIKLTTRPSANVTITLSSSDTTEGTVRSFLTFTPDTWNLARTVIVTGVNDALTDGNIAYSIVTGAVTSADTSYSSLDPAGIPDISVTNNDDETSGSAATVTSIAPVGTLTQTPVTFTWVGNASSYRLNILQEISVEGELQTFALVKNSYEAGVVCENGMCSVQPNIPLTPGMTYVWIVEALGADGQVIGSAALSFTMPSVMVAPTTPELPELPPTDSGLLPPVTLVSPVRETSENPVAFTWIGAADASEYRLLVQNQADRSAVVDVTVSTASCNGNVCVFVPDFAPQAGVNYVWTVTPISSSGAGTPSAEANFSYNPAAPGDGIELPGTIIGG